MSNHQPTRGMKLEPFRASGISETEVEQYALVSGDRNPIHTDRNLATKAGLVDLPVHGMFIMALVANYVENWPFYQHLKDLQVRFVKPAVINREIMISARVVSVSQTQDQAILRISTLQDDKLVAMGEADISIAIPSI